MTDGPDIPGPREPDSPWSPRRLTLLERLGISPVMFAFLALVVVFVLYQIIGGLVTLLIYGYKPSQSNTFGFRLTTGVGQILLIFLPTLVLVRFISFASKPFLRLRLPRLRTFIASLVGIFSLQQMLQIYMVFQDRIPFPEPLRSRIQELRDFIDQMYKVLATSSTMPELLWVILIVALIPAVSEEFLFRGLVQRSFERVATPMRAAIAAGIVFAFYHLNPFSFVPLAVLGIYLGFLAQRADSLWASVAAHFYNNFFACIAMYVQVRDDYVVTGNAEEMSLGGLLLTFWFFGVIFIVSTLYFIKITSPVQVSDSSPDIQHPTSP